jgi:hypothetical protein
MDLEDHDLSFSDCLSFPHYEFVFPTLDVADQGIFVESRLLDNSRQLGGRHRNGRLGTRITVKGISPEIKRRVKGNCFTVICKRLVQDCETRLIRLAITCEMGNDQGIWFQNYMLSGILTEQTGRR